MDLTEQIPKESDDVTKSLSDSDSDILDEELENDELDTEIKETEDALENIEHPDEMNGGPEFTEEMMKEIYEKLMKMPRKDAASFLSNLGKGIEKNKHNLTSDQNKHSLKEQYQMKLRDLEMRRRGKSSMKLLEKRKEFNDKLKEAETSVKDETPKPMPESDTTSDSNVLTKSKKKRLRQKAKLQKTNVDSSDEHAA